MIARTLFLSLILACAPVFASGPNVLSNTDHIVSDVTAAISILSGSNTVDQTCPTGTTPGVSCFSVGGPGFVSALMLPSYATNSVITNYLAGTATPANHAPYGVLNQSSTGYDLALDQSNYNALESAPALFVMAFCGGPGSDGAYPPIAMSTILPNTTGPLSGNTCGYATGIEFSMTAGYKGFATGSPSGTTEAFSGVYAVLAANHPTWTWGDVKSALRQTASNWSGGYTAFNASGPGFGFGNIDYDSANAISSTASIYLQSPGMQLLNHGHYLTIVLYPFLTTRRAKEVVYIGGTWPAASTGNELTAAQIASAGGTKIIDDGGATGTQSFTYAPAATGSAVFTALTLDASGNGSRVESFNSVSQSFVVGSACLQ